MRWTDLPPDGGASDGGPSGLRRREWEQLRQRLERLPVGHPSSPDGEAEDDDAWDDDDQQGDARDGRARERAAREASEPGSGGRDPEGDRRPSGREPEGGHRPAGPEGAGRAVRRGGDDEATRRTGHDEDSAGAAGAGRREPYRPWFVSGEPADPWFASGT